MILLHFGINFCFIILQMRKSRERKKKQAKERKNKRPLFVDSILTNFSFLHFTLLYFTLSTTSLSIFFLYFNIFQVQILKSLLFFGASIVPFHQWSTWPSLSNCSENLFLEKNKNVDDEKSSFLSSSNFVKKKLGQLMKN